MQRRQILGFGENYDIENYCAVINAFGEFCFTDNRLEEVGKDDIYLKAQAIYMADTYGESYIKDKLYEKHGVNNLLYFLVINNARGCPVSVNMQELMPYVVANARNISVKALGESASLLAAQATFTEIMD